MHIGILGTLTVSVNGVSITPTAPKARQVLALLAVRADQVVPVDALIEELWDAVPPRSARTTVQTYVLQLRELITAALEKPGEGEGRTAKDVLVTLPGGYLLRSGDGDGAGGCEGTSDIRDFERLSEVGYRAMEAGDFTEAARNLREALALWSGPALVDVQAGKQLDTEIKRLEETRLCALDQRIEAELRLGQHRSLLAELTVLIRRYPTHETLCGQYMLALHRSGRRGEALDAYQRLRNTLVRSKGLEPSAWLRKLQRSILSAGENGNPAIPAEDRQSVRLSTAC
ncbi:BTAD domain-containing putative transcriptional regulator [Streptomyces sp. NPDC007984]|uniref:AfsR/SARP family transcriptional regulator n=1 Tax=Streptomyces sp. NPDC007984 TaxID=3364801 RepID=UPI0036EB8370